MKIVLRSLAFVAAITAGAVLLSALLVVGSMLARPPVTVAVHAKQEGLNLWLPLPSLWLTTAARLVPLDEHLGELSEEHRRALTQAEELVDELLAAGDVELVRVDGSSERVLIARRGRRVRVEVRSLDADVDIEVPVSTLRTLAKQVAG